MEKSIKKFDPTSYLVKSESGVLRWIVRSRYKIYTLLVLGFSLIMISRLPYLNLFITKQLLIFLVLTLTLVVFRISTRKIILLALAFLVIAIPFFLLKRFEVAESIGNFAYGVLFLGVLKFILDKDH